jgi:hypothetical protein
MTQIDLTCADSGIDTPSRANRIRLAESTGETKQGERRYPGLGALLVLASAVVFYGGIAVLVRKFL